MGAVLCLSTEAVSKCTLLKILATSLLALLFLLEKSSQLCLSLSAADGFNQVALFTSSCLCVLQLLGSHAIPEREYLELNLSNDLTQEIIHFIQFPLPRI